MSTLTLKGPHWVTARQYRRTLWLAAAAVGGSLAVIGGLRIWDATQDTELPDRWGRGYDLLRGAMEQFSQGMLALPLLVGAFVAGPLIAREFESGTYKLSLTQSITPDSQRTTDTRNSAADLPRCGTRVISPFRV